jgi:hypothetical protein
MFPQRFAVWLAMLALILCSFVSSGDDPSKKEQDKKKPGFTISKETTYVTGPLREGGYIDYVAALNERMKQGVTPENNAMVLLVRALGPVIDGSKLSDRYFKELGCEKLPAEGKYFRDFKQFLKDSQKPAMENEQLWELHGRLSSRPWSRKEFPDAEKWIKVNVEPLRLAQLASLRTAYYSPAGCSDQKNEYHGVFSLISHSMHIQHLAELMLCRAMLLTNDNKMSDAKQDIVACHRLARLVSQDISNFEWLMGSWLETQAIEAGICWLEQPELPTSLILEYQRELARLSSMPKLADKAESYDRFHLLDTILLVTQHGFKLLERLAGGTGDGAGIKLFDQLLFQNLNWDPALKKANAWHDRIAAALKNTDRNERLRATDEIEAELKALRRKLADEFPIRIAESKESRVLAVYDMTRCLLTPVIFKVQISADIMEQQQRQLQLAIALALYHREKGQYPEKLSELSPKYLPTIPLDLFSGKDVIYSRTEKGYRLYSVGPNGKDDGGMKDDEYPHKTDDILLEVPLPEWKKK